MPTLQELSRGGMTTVTAPSGAQLSPASGYPAAPVNGGMQPLSATPSTGPSASPNAPAISWVALVAVLVLIRIAYEKGARLD
jgi:hypothetical protein